MELLRNSLSNNKSLVCVTVASTASRINFRDNLENRPQYITLPIKILKGSPPIKFGKDDKATGPFKLMQQLSQSNLLKYSRNL